MYALYSLNRNQVFYIGRTEHPADRQRAHRANVKRFGDFMPFDLVIVWDGMTLREARGLEQTLIAGFTFDAILNKINAIAVGNHEEFRAELRRAESLISGFFD